MLLIFTAVSIFTQDRLSQLVAKDSHIQQLSERQENALALKSLIETMDSTASGYLLSGKTELEQRYRDNVPELERLVGLVGGSAETREQRNWRARLDMVSQEFVAQFAHSAGIAADADSDVADRQRRVIAAFNASQIHKQVMFDLVESFYKDYSAAEAAARVDYSELVKSTSAVTLWANAAAVVVAIVVSWLVIRSLIGGVRLLRQGIERVKDGDLTQNVASRSKDELGRLGDSFDATVAAVRSMLAHTKRIAESLTEHSRHFGAFAAATKETNTSIVRAMDEIAAGAAKQAEQSDASVSTIQELEDRMDGIIGATEVLLGTSLDAKRAAKEGGDNVEALRSSTERTGGALRTMSDALRRLEKRSGEIADITNSIHSISQQTNILALNAAIEAARAGAEGRGFSVIAEEVRLLSLQTTESSKRIDDILRQLRSGVNEAAETLQHTADRFTEQKGQVQETGGTFRSIAMLIEGFDREITHISDRVREAKTKQSELVDSLQVVASVAQQTAAGVQETAASAADQDESVGQIAVEAADIHRLADSLFREIDKFKTV
ncbi:methyl-accepting chemotaxis protein [Paenibacillus sp. TRM 82003]|nr:methyl-accepting chemotaxis protein [Paenibacillus sp. TRM 82003]